MIKIDCMDVPVYFGSNKELLMHTGIITPFKKGKRKDRYEILIDQEEPRYSTWKQIYKTNKL